MTGAIADAGEIAITEAAVHPRLSYDHHRDAIREIVRELPYRQRVEIMRRLFAMQSAFDACADGAEDRETGARRRRFRVSLQIGWMR